MIYFLNFIQKITSPEKIGKELKNLNLLYNN